MKTSIDHLNTHLFEVIEMLKNNSDKKASANEKIDIETAKTISDLAKNVVEGYKVKAQVLNIISRSDNPTIVKQLSQSFGVSENE
ncbi:MAG: hypothetical protein AB9922_12265 [Bacteroidales bacterium]